MYTQNGCSPAADLGDEPLAIVAIVVAAAVVDLVCCEAEGVLVVGYVVGVVCDAPFMDDALNELASAAFVVLFDETLVSSDDDSDDVPLTAMDVFVL